MEGTMKRVMLMGKGGPFEMWDVPIPKPGPGQTLVKVLSTSICNQTDLNTVKTRHVPHELQRRLMLPHHFRMWDNRLEGDEMAKYYNRNFDYVNSKPYPATLGHEAMGEIVELGQFVPGNNEELKVGDRVSWTGSDSTLGQYTIAPTSNVVKVPEDIPNDWAGFIEPSSILWVGAHIVCPEDVVCILGQGALGLLATQWVRIFGAKTIIASDPVKHKRELSKKFGADYVFDPTTDDVTAEIDKLTGGKGCDIVMECSGFPGAVQIAPYLVKFGGLIVQVGAPCDPILTEWGYIHFKGLTVCGMGGLQTKASGPGRYANTLKAISEWRKKGKLFFSDMITHRPKFTAEGVAETFKEIDRGNVVRAVFEPWRE